MIHGEVTESRNPSLPLICTCDKCMQRSERNRQMNKNIYDVLSIPDVTFFFHTSAAQRARELSQTCDILCCVSADFWFRMGGGSLEEDRSCSFFFSFVRQWRRVKTARQTSVDLQKRSGRDPEGVRSNVSTPRTEKLSDTRTTSCSESAHVLCVRAVHARRLEQHKESCPWSKIWIDSAYFTKHMKYWGKSANTKMNARTFWTDGKRWQISQISVRYFLKKIEESIIQHDEIAWEDHSYTATREEVKTRTHGNFDWMQRV